MCIWSHLNRIGLSLHIVAFVFVALFARKCVSAVCCWCRKGSLTRRDVFIQAVRTFDSIHELAHSECSSASGTFPTAEDPRPLHVPSYPVISPTLPSPFPPHSIQYPLPLLISLTSYLYFLHVLACAMFHQGFLRIP
jgi:hypothetical protein